MFIINRTIQIRNSRNREQNQVVELLSERLDLHGLTAQSIYDKNKFLHQVNVDTVRLITFDYN